MPSIAHRAFRRVSEIMIPASIIFVKREKAELTQKERCWGLKFPVIPADNKNRESRKMGNKISRENEEEGKKAELAFAKVLDTKDIFWLHIDQIPTFFSKRLKNRNAKRPDYFTCLNGKQVFIDVKAHTVHDGKYYHIYWKDIVDLYALELCLKIPVWLAVTDKGIGRYDEFIYAAIDDLQVERRHFIDGGDKLDVYFLPVEWEKNIMKIFERESYMYNTEWDEFIEEELREWKT